MDELDGNTAENNDLTDGDTEEDLGAAYEALAEDRRRQELERHNAELTAPAADDLEPAPDGVEESGPALIDAQRRPTDADAAEPATAPPAVAASRVFIIDGREYPDPDPQLPITGARSVQAMYRDYFPGQLDNADTVQKTRPDGKLEVTFKRRIGTKGVPGALLEPSAASGSITVSAIARILSGLAPYRPLAWGLIEQALDSKGRVRLEFAPAPAELNLAEAQQRTQARLIEQAVAELRCVRRTV
jgi:hypothetical protein